MEKINELKKQMKEKWKEYDSTEKTIDPSHYSFKEKFNVKLIASYMKEQPEYALIKESAEVLFKHGWGTVFALTQMMFWFVVLMYFYDRAYDFMGFDHLLIMFFVILSLTLGNLAKMLEAIINELKKLNDEK